MASQQRRFTRFARTIALRQPRCASSLFPRCSGGGGDGGDGSELGFTPAEQDRTAPSPCGWTHPANRRSKPSRRPIPDVELNVETYDGNATARVPSRPRSRCSTRPAGVARRRLLDAEQRRGLGSQGDQRRAGLRRAAQQGPASTKTSSTASPRARSTRSPSTARCTACATTCAQRCSGTTRR